MAGLLCARLLTDAGVDCALAEADTLCGGVTQNTTAKITAQHGLIYDKLIREFGEEQAKRYLNANLAALERYRQMCADIDCDFETRDAYVYARGERKKIDDELRALDALGFHAAFGAGAAAAVSGGGRGALCGAGAVSPAEICSRHRAGAARL